MGMILNLLSDAKNIIIMIVVILLSVSMFAATLYKARYERLKIKQEQEYLAYQQRVQKEMYAYAEKIKSLTVEKKYLDEKIKQLREGKNETYNKIFDDISLRFNSGV